MTSQQKRIYNQENYRKNREVILGRVKSKYVPKKKNPKVIQLFSSGTKETSKPGRRTKKPSRISWGTILLQVFVGAMTGFLVSETAHFYATVDGTQAAAYLKALILEGAVFSFTLIKARTTVTGVVYKLMILLVYAYSAWAISSTVVSNALEQYSKIEFRRKSVADLESEVVEKAKLRASLVESKRLTLSNRVDQTLNELRQKLEIGRASLQKLPEPTVLLNALLSLVVFRILTMFTNLLCLKELVRRYRLNTRGV